MYRLSRCILLAHEDKIFQGAMVASMSIPWGETKWDNDLGGYHLVWTRDLVQSATALLATGQTSTPLRALIWLAAIQQPDGSFPQNSWIDGPHVLVRSAIGRNCRADVAGLAPVPRREGVESGQCDTRVMMVRAAAFTHPARAGDLPGTLGGERRLSLLRRSPPSIAALVCAAEFAWRHHQEKSAEFILVYADWLAAHSRNGR